MIHLLSFYTTSKMIHMCNFCEYQTPFKANLKRHVKNKSNSYAYVVHASNTVSAGPHYAAANGDVVQHGVDALNPHFDSNHMKQLYKPNQYSYAQPSKAPTTVSVPPLGSTGQYGSGVYMDTNNESVESDVESDDEDEDSEDEERSFWVIAEELINTFLDPSITPTKRVNWKGFEACIENICMVRSYCV